MKLPTTAHTGKSLNSLGYLNAAQEGQFKRQQMDGSDKTRTDFAMQPKLTSREQRSLSRGMSRRETKLRRDFDKRGSYLGNRIYELTSHLDSTEKHIARLQDGLAQNNLASLLGPLAHPSPAEEGDTADDEGGWTLDEEDEWKEELSDAPKNRLWYQGFSTLQVLREEQARDHEQLRLTQLAKALADVEYSTPEALQEAGAKRF